MSAQDFLEISIRGRVAFSILCLENAVKFYHYNTKEWGFIFDSLWTFCDQNMAIWQESVAEITPSVVCEEVDFLKKGYRYHTKETHDHLQLVYSESHEVVLQIIDQIHELGITNINVSITSEKLKKASLPTGAIMMWSGSIASIPSGWGLCDGSAGRPDLRNRFVMGARASYGVSAVGGAENIVINANQLPAHVHEINDNHSSPNVNTTGFTVITDGYFGGSSSATTRKNITSNSPVDIRPPYYALAYIIKL